MSLLPVVMVVEAAGADVAVREAPAEACVTAIVWLPTARSEEARVPMPRAPPPTATRSGPLVICAVSELTLPAEISESAWASESTLKVMDPPMAPEPTVAVASSVEELGIHACHPDGDSRVSAADWSVATSEEMFW